MSQEQINNQNEGTTGYQDPLERTAEKEDGKGYRDPLENQDGKEVKRKYPNLQSGQVSAVLF